eukprot:GHVN01026734.1.p1 GENE.GHVN01026734.1~~GHVN01026734.1.p1  ORF type:complete len:139 (+),score=12.87 GHVN01026734.1:758-1174(+)
MMWMLSRCDKNDATDINPDAIAATPNTNICRNHSDSIRKRLDLCLCCAFLSLFLPSSSLSESTVLVSRMSAAHSASSNPAVLPEFSCTLIATSIFLHVVLSAMMTGDTKDNSFSNLSWVRNPFPSQLFSVVCEHASSN